MSFSGMSNLIGLLIGGCAKRRKRTACVKLLAVLVVIMLGVRSITWLTYIKGTLYGEYCAVPKKAVPIGKDKNVCHIPKVNPFNAQAMELVADVEPVKCTTKKKAYLKNGELTIKDSNVVRAAYREVIRPSGDDFASMVGDWENLELTGKKIKIKEEFIELQLEKRNGDTQTEFLLQAVPRPEILKRRQLKTKLNMSIVVIGLETVSHAHAQRKIPKSYRFIKEELGGFIFEGHSVVGDGTTEQLAAMLSGKGEREYGESRKKMPDAKSVDGWNWIFKDAKKKGYVTSFDEDAPNVASFNYRLTGFEDPPADYYPRAFYQEAYKSYDHATNQDCIGSQKIHNYHLDLPRRIYEAYPGRNKLLFHFECQLSHNFFNSIQRIDDDLLKFMTEFKSKGYFDNTLFILMGDHGWRYGEFRQTVQGKLEERMPLFTMSFPESFKQRYPDLAANLKANTERLTSWFDVYATMKHILHYPYRPKHLAHGVSLFDKVPRDRGCEHAGIPIHWCPCVSWSEVDRSHAHVKAAALEAVRHVNTLNSAPRAEGKCAVLKLEHIAAAEVEIPKTEVLKFQETSGGDGYFPEYSSAAQQKGVCRYRLTFTASPSHAIYEATVFYEYGQFVVSKDLNRLNAYGEQPKCVAAKLPNLRKYCYCKQPEHTTLASPQPST